MGQCDRQCIAAGDGASEIKNGDVREAEAVHTGADAGADPAPDLRVYERGAVCQDRAGIPGDQLYGSHDDRPAEEPPAL